MKSFNAAAKTCKILRFCDETNRIVKRTNRVVTYNSETVRFFRARRRIGPHRIENPRHMRHVRHTKKYGSRRISRAVWVTAPFGFFFFWLRKISKYFKRF